MNLAWLFGSGTAAHHLLYAYLSVWIIQGGYVARVAWNWKRSRRDSWAALRQSHRSPEDV
jgi:hypothetical protein